MGANASTPRQVSFDNPHPRPESENVQSLVVTQSVVDRVEGQLAAERFNRDNTLHSHRSVSNITPENPVHPENLFTLHPFQSANEESQQQQPEEAATRNPEANVLENTERTSTTRNNDNVNAPLPENMYLPSSPPVPQAPFPTSNSFCQNCKGKKISGQEEVSQIEEIQQAQFSETFDKIEKILGKSDKWHDEFGSYIKEQKEKLIQCYKSEEKRESFECEKLAQDFQKHLLVMQYKTLNDQAKTETN